MLYSGYDFLNEFASLSLGFVLLWCLRRCFLSASSKGSLRPRGEHGKQKSSDAEEAVPYFAEWSDSDDQCDDARLLPTSSHSLECATVFENTSSAVRRRPRRRGKKRAVARIACYSQVPAPAGLVSQTNSTSQLQCLGSSPGLPPAWRPPPGLPPPDFAPQWAFGNFVFVQRPLEGTATQEERELMSHWREAMSSTLTVF